MSLGRDLAAVLVGGVIGTGARLAIDAALPHDDGQFPLSTLLINTVGAFALGLLVARVWPTAPSWLRAGLGAGILGSFTTFSAVAVAIIPLTTTGRGMTALAYLGLTLLLGLGAAWLGLVAGRRGAGKGPE